MLYFEFLTEKGVNVKCNKNLERTISRHIFNDLCQGTLFLVSRPLLMYYQFIKIFQIAFNIALDTENWTKVIYNNKFVEFVEFVFESIIRKCYNTLLCVLFVSKVASVRTFCLPSHKAVNDVQRKTNKIVNAILKVVYSNCT